MKTQSKAFIIIIILSILMKFSVSGQTYSNTTIYTPNGTSVTAQTLTSGEMSSYMKNYVKNYWLDYYDNRITYLGEATYTYNCHAYAWWISEGGSTVWLDHPGDDEFWDDGSYVEVSSQSSATKVSFCSVNHSAITTGTEDLFISKWGLSPLFRHDVNDCPYDPQDLHYYIFRPTITGSNVVCPTGTEFTVNNILTGFTVTWSSDPIPEDEDYSISSTDNECTITNDHHVGAIVLTATIFNDFDTIIISKEILLTYSPNYYTFYASLTTGGNTDWLQDCEGLLTYTFPGMYSGDIEIWDPEYVPFINHVTWTKISQGNCSFADIGASSDGKSVFLNFKPLGCSAVLRMTATNGCGSFQNDYTFIAGIGCEKKSQSVNMPSQVLIYPNPTDGIFTIKCTSEDSNSGIKEIIVKNYFGGELLRKKYSGQESITLDISKQMTGIYFLDVFDGKEWTTHQICVQK